METEKRIIEINGVKMEVDLRDVKIIENYRVGDNIKILIKDGYGDKFASYIGSIIGFDDYKEHPTIVIAYLQTSYSKAEIKYCYYNETTKDVELCPLNDWDVPVTKQQMEDEFENEIKKHKREIEDTEQNHRLFIKLFGKYFEKIEKDLIEE